MDWREHPLLALMALVLIVLVTVYLLGRGCGCWNRAPVVAAADKGGTTAKGNTTAGKAKKVWMDDCAEPPNWGKEEQAPKPAAANLLPQAQPRQPCARKRSQRRSTKGKGLVASR